MTKMNKQKKLSILNVFKGGFSPGSSGREAAKEYKESKAEKNTEIVFGNIKNRLAKGETVKVPKFGTFNPRKRAAQIVKKPRTGEKVSEQARNKPFFMPDEKLKEILKP